MTLSVPESVISIYIEKRRQLLYEVSPFGEFFCWYTFGKQSLLIYELTLLNELLIPDKYREHHYCYGDYALYKEELP